MQIQIVSKKIIKGKNFMGAIKTLFVKREKTFLKRGFTFFIYCRALNFWYGGI